MANEPKWENLYRVLNEYADYWIRTAQEKIQQNGNIASGDLVSTMGAQREISFKNDYISVKVSMLEYWQYVEKGSKPHWPPIDAIKKWIEVKPVIPQVMTLTRHTKTKGDVQYQVLPTVKQLAYLISRKISIEGTPAHPFFEEAQNEAMQHFEDAISYAIEEDWLEWIEENVYPLL